MTHLPNPDGEAPNPISQAGWIVAYCDGGSRGNPGPAGFGVYIQDEEGAALGELSRYLGRKTNNFAEYSALLAALEFAAANGHRRLRVISDSELMVKQMKGQYRVNSPELRPLYEEARRGVRDLDQFEIRHVLREKNRHADRLANLAMDRGTGKDTPETLSKPAQRGFRGLVKNGVVHLLQGELPDGTFVKITPE